MRSHRSPSAGWLVSLAAACTFAPALVHAATLVVDVDGTYDAGATTCSGTDAAFTAIQAAVTASASGDTILVCPGTYNEAQITLNKALTVQSVAGAAATIIDGTGGTGLAFAGTVVLNATAGNVTFDGFTVRNAKAGPSSVRINVRVGSTAAVTMTVVNNVLQGTNNPADTRDYGLYAAGPNANDTFVFQHNELRQHGSNPILIERHKGPTDVSHNTFDRGVSQNGVSAYVNMSHSGDVVANLQKVSHNTIDLGNDPGPYTNTNRSTGIAFLGALTGTTVGRFTNVEISDNTITNVRAFRSGIALQNSANSLANQTLGEIANAVVSCNRIAGFATPEASSSGIRLIGYVTGAQIGNNDAGGVDYGFRSQPLNGHIAPGATVGANSLANTVTAAIDWQSSGTLAAESNWYGDPSGPTNAGNPAGTGGVILNPSGPVDFTPWLVSGGDADPGPCFVPGCGNGTTDLHEDCDLGASNGDPGACCTASCTFRAAGDTCRAAADLCDVAETCTGAAAACPADAVATAGTSCRPAAGECDVAEVCDGTNAACPADSVAGAFVTCRPSAGACDPAEQCDGVATACPTDLLAGAGTTCRAAADVCDLAEECDGASPACPADGKSSAVCRPAAGQCDVAESCDGVGDACPPDGFVAAGTVCRPAAGACDVVEACTGASGACPTDAFKPTGTVCRGSAGVCDLAEQCAGGPTCPADGKSSAVCRPAAGQCDVAESCDGVGDACPADAFQPDGTACSSGFVCALPDTCQSGVCTSGGGPDSDGDNVCDGSDNCPGVPNPGQGDLDGDGAGDPCDTRDAALNPTRSRIKTTPPGPRDTSSTKVKGDFVTLAPGDAFTAASGVTLAVSDGKPVPTVVTRTYSPAECETKATRIKCRSADRLAAATFKTSASAPGVWRFVAKTKRNGILGPLVGPTIVSLTYGADVDRVGEIVDCATSFTGLTCRQQH